MPDDQPVFITIADAADTTWITEGDLALLITIADFAQEFALNWGILATADAEQAGERLDEIADELIPLLQQYDERFPQAPADQPIPYTVKIATTGQQSCTNSTPSVNTHRRAA